MGQLILLISVATYIVCEASQKPSSDDIVVAYIDAADIATPANPTLIPPSRHSSEWYNKPGHHHHHPYLYGPANTHGTIENNWHGGEGIHGGNWNSQQVNTRYSNDWYGELGHHHHHPPPYYGPANIDGTIANNWQGEGGIQSGNANIQQVNGYHSHDLYSEPGFYRYHNGAANTNGIIDSNWQGGGGVQGGNSNTQQVILNEKVPYNTRPWLDYNYYYRHSGPGIYEHNQNNANAGPFDDYPESNDKSNAADVIDVLHHLIGDHNNVHSANPSHQNCKSKLAAALSVLINEIKNCDCGDKEANVIVPGVIPLIPSPSSSSIQSGSLWKNNHVNPSSNNAWDFSVLSKSYTSSNSATKEHAKDDKHVSQEKSDATMKSNSDKREPSSQENSKVVEDVKKIEASVDKAPKRKSRFDRFYKLFY